ncbi:MAG: response regulator [Thermoplasmatales archaeon]|nr:MAG: response regulator [Thermoplasmatales archaeon]
MKKIMVVDDNPDHLHSIKQILEKMGDDYKVTCASSGMRCLKLLENNDVPDLILLDIMMPKMNGWETFKNLQENPSWRNIPVVFLTARTDDFAENAGKFLAADYIEKPFDLEDFKEKIGKVLKKNSSENI